ncbi:DMT family transporter [Nitriliruptor alkaliphilus]|uniref:DMT family transporter n=1 Tax=Nitriliruptor alkaliphilus TaxID=427918 RepID=UPI0024814174|nr:DMT family transporter [Nitriliruptor alkaliphilus]
MLALCAAVSFGVSDVTGALAARRASAVTVTLIAQLAGLVVLLPALLVLPGELSLRALAIGALAGLGGCAGLIVYLRGMAIGPMGVVSPLAALVGAAVPVGWGVVVNAERVTALDVMGILAGLVAVVLVALRPRQLTDVHAGGTLLALLSGAAFGGFFVALDATPPDSGLWPLLGARLSGALLLVVVLRFAPRRMPDRRTAPLVIACGLTDMGANVLFLLATRTGALSLTALLTSLYPVAVVLLARRLTDERLTVLQASGVVLALCASALIVL